MVMIVRMRIIIIINDANYGNIQDNNYYYYYYYS